ncbi:lysoplasmalogenase [Leucobacter chromiireducens]|uniref:Lysoplasmalogenase n=1 Tax=Leucobacter chromiireducens subsp. chromiireducens TaxID=660067 RepID=A0ABS1STW5_9MICO|nr:lysoplasmalogenase [Leucobacter chromiireducens subsp. chromiireducens]
MNTRLRAALPFVPYIVVSIVHVTARFLEHPIDAPTKLLLMPALALGVLWASAGIRPWPRGVIVLLVASIFFSWLGDGSATFFPMFESELPMMLACFGLAHVGYVLLMWRARGVAVRRVPAWALVYALAYVVMIALLVPHTGALTVPVIVYGLLLAGTAAMASRCGPVIAWGGAWFLVSDAILSFRIFLPEVMPDWTSGMVMLTYTLGQGLIAAGIVTALRRRAAGSMAAPGVPGAPAAASSRPA